MRMRWTRHVYTDEGHERWIGLRAKATMGAQRGAGHETQRSGIVIAIATVKGTIGTALPAYLAVDYHLR